MMRWDELIRDVRTVDVSDAASTADVSDVQYDSRRVGSGDLFVAMRGGSTDGNRFVDAAIERGAVAILTDTREVFEDVRTRKRDLPVALVEHGRRALAQASAAAFGHPEQRMAISAVTGTNGKTTTAFLLEQMLRSVGRRSVLLGTIETRIGSVVRASEHTTPESRDVLAAFAEGVRAGCTEVVMEASSHALAQERVWGLPVDVAVFTNLTQDHLDFHGTMEEYARAKARLFEGVGTPPPRAAVVNADDPAVERMETAWRASLAHSGETAHELRGHGVVRYGVDRGEWRAQDVELSPGRTRFRWSTPKGSIHIETPLTGVVNVYNFLAAACAAVARGLSIEEVGRAARLLEPAPGRFEVVPQSADAGFSVIVDYAHTDDALRNVLALARSFAQGHRVITLFGCGGDRDRTKRPKMGRAAAEASDVVILTSDNPRSEDPLAIIDEVLVGVRDASAEIVVEADRRRAIERAIQAARTGDIVLLAGKGHEKTQVFAHGEEPFDDVAEAARVLRSLVEERAG